ncbi:hypothetical protein RDWZM_001759 [Blomia tropicalis]|uniref:Uncharacterized protein n=1 Tax=Blomia tropicalis TaxID=40697 RepID=A0A9Q0MCJ1_BLOTA|nr:hypothetical protein RDWZM_001759 [Blomia tropicalis]
MNNDNDQCHNSSNESQKPNSSNSIDTNMFNQQQQPNNRRSKSSMLKMCCIDAKNGSNVSQTTSTRTIQDEPRSILTSKNNSKNMVKCKQKKKKKKVSYVSTINNATILESRYVERSKTHSYRRQSRLLSKTNELLCCTICGWIILLSYTPKLLHNGSKACFNQWVPSWQIMDKFPNVNSYYKNDKMFLRMEPISEISFNISEWNEITFTMLIPLILIVFHHKLCLPFWYWFNDIFGIRNTCYNMIYGSQPHQMTSTTIVNNSNNNNNNVNHV